LISICSNAPCVWKFVLEVRSARSGRLRHLAAQLLESVADACVEDPVADLEDEAADDRLVDLAGQLDRLAGLALDLGADRGDDRGVELDRAWRFIGTSLLWFFFGLVGLIAGILVFPLIALLVRDNKRRQVLARKIIGHAFG
jgi:hypothetical protein